MTALGGGGGELKNQHSRMHISRDTTSAKDNSVVHTGYMVWVSFDRKIKSWWCKKITFVVAVVHKVT